MWGGNGEASEAYTSVTTGYLKEGNLWVGVAPGGVRPIISRLEFQTRNMYQAMRKWRKKNPGINAGDTARARMCCCA